LTRPVPIKPLMYFVDMQWIDPLIASYTAMAALGHNAF
jgi:hypothetical protein